MIRKIALLLLMVAMSMLPTWAAMPSVVKVRLFEAHPDIKRVRIHGRLQVLKPMRQNLPNGDYQLSVQQGALGLSRLSSHRVLIQSSRLLLKTGTHSMSLQPDGLQPRQYSGVLEFTLDSNGKINIINEMPARNYVAGVVGSETLPGWPLEALKAQAVLTQTGLSRYHTSDVIGDSTQREVYLGLSHVRPEVSQAVRAVWGQTLTYNHRPITPFYHASCGGHTSNGQLLGTKNFLPWLTAVTCPYCRNAPFSKPTRTTIPKANFTKQWGDSLPTIAQVDAAGRPLRLQLKNGKSVSGYDFWIRLGRQFGWDKAPGLRFSLMQLPNGNVQITSTGAGHGLGLCQWGAAGMARQGKLYPEILRFYFPKARLSKPIQ